MFMLLSTHKRILATHRAAIDRARDTAEFHRRNGIKLGKVIRELCDERDALRARLARFTGPRQRDERGHFVKDEG